MATKKKPTTKKRAETGSAPLDPEAVRTEVVAQLRAAADPARAKAMQAYMKTTMAFWGVANPAVRTLCREVFSRHPVETKEEWLAVARHLWRTATRREEWFAAIEWTGLRAARAWQQPDVLPLYEEMIVSSAWWDTVDVLAVHRVGALLKNDPRKMKPILLRWAKGDDLWKRRAAILSQLQLKEGADLDFLFATMAPSLTRKEFWLRKAIGWALRHQARWHEDEVLAFVRAHEGELSGLTKREALKHYPEKVRASLS
jgi:3-methyladenine DNA glycosylase AlkD